MKMKLRVGYGAAILAGICLSFALHQGIEWLLRNSGHRKAIWAGLLLSGLIVVVVSRWTPVPRLLERWREHLEGLPIPRFTLWRIIVLVSVVGGECWCFFCFSDAEEVSDPGFVLLVAGLIVTLSVLENIWVAMDRRAGKTARPSRTRFI